ncbi:hypothetical protein BH24ACI4_BH24ACI4_21670 [soil metagenome]
MTHSRRILCAALCCLALVLTFSASAVAEQTVLTFSSPVQLPTVLLPAGTYHFTVNDGDRGLMTVTGTGGRFVTRFSVNPTTRAKAGEKVVMRSVEGQPSEVSALYPTGGKSGMEFIYHRAKR